VKTHAHLPFWAITKLKESPLDGNHMKRKGAKRRHVMVALFKTNDAGLTASLAEWEPLKLPKQHGSCRPFK